MHTDTIDPFFVFDQKGENKMLHAESTDKIINSFFKVYNTLGYGFLEKVYENALVIELKRAEFKVLQQQNIKVFYENQVVGDYFADIIADQVILEIKAAEGLRDENKAQLINYLKATDKEVGLLLNFGKTPEFKRVIFTNDRKERFESETPNPCVSVESVSSVFPSV
jgi:GxxExxY protein